MARPPARPPGRDSAWRTTLLLALLALVLRAGWLAYARPEPVSDFAKYRSVAVEILEHHQVGYPAPSAERLPAFPLFLAALMLVSRSTAWLGFGTVMLSTLLVPLAHRLALRLGGGDTRLAAIAGLACALDPTFVFWAPILASEHLLAVLLVGGLLLLLPGYGAARLPLAGAALGAAALARGEGAFYLPLFVGVAAWTAGRGRRLRAVALVLVPFVLLTGAWAARNRARIGPGAGLSTTSGPNFYMAHNGRTYGYVPMVTSGRELEVQRETYRLALEALRRRPAALIGQVVQGTRRLYASGGYATYWSAVVPRGDGAGGYGRRPIPGLGVLHRLEYLGYAAILALALLSVLSWRRFPAPAWAIPLGVIGLNWLCYAVVFWADARYRYPAEVALCLLAALTVRRFLPVPRRAP